MLIPNMFRFLRQIQRCGFKNKYDNNFVILKSFMSKFTTFRINISRLVIMCVWEEFITLFQILSRLIIIVWKFLSEFVGRWDQAILRRSLQEDR